MRAIASLAHNRVGRIAESGLQALVAAPCFTSCFQGVDMKNLAFALSILLCTVSAGHAQSSNGPAELPPAEFEGREFTDSQGCVFLRSTFAGQVTWIPRFGPDRMPVCGQAPTEFAASALDADVTPVDAPVAEAAPEPAPAPVAAAPVASAAAAAPPRPAAQPQPRRAAPAPATRATPPRQRQPRADASGRHPDCPASAPFGQLVDTALGRPLVRCVTSPLLFLPEYVYPPSSSRVAPSAGSRQHAAASPAMRGGRSVQVGSFAVASNATRLRARLQHAGLPARIHQSRGLAVVTVGPLSSAGQAHSALASVQRMGFHDAFLR